MDKNIVIRENFSKVAKWVKESFPHAIEASFQRRIKCMSVHHVYHTSYLVIDKGIIYHHRGSHG